MLSPIRYIMSSYAVPPGEGSNHRTLALEAALRLPRSVQGHPGTVSCPQSRRLTAAYPTVNAFLRVPLVYGAARLRALQTSDSEIRRYRANGLGFFSALAT